MFLQVHDIERSAIASCRPAPLPLLDLQSVSGPILNFRTYTIVESATARALEIGSTVTGGSFNTVSDWTRLLYIVSALGVALAAYRSYSSVTGEAAGMQGAVPCWCGLLGVTRSS